MRKVNFITIPENCSAKKLALLFDSKINDLNFSKIAIKFNKNKIKGIITLGDLRRILAKQGRDILVDNYLNKNPILIDEKKLNNQIHSFLEKKIQSRYLKKIDQLIILNNKKEIVDIIDVEEINKNSFYKEISILGLGHIGLPLATHLLKRFTHINGVDIDIKKIKDIKNNKLYFYEKNFEKTLKENIKNKRLLLTSDLKKIRSQIYIICLGTEFKNNKLISNEKLIKVLKDLASIIKKNDLIILRGTVQVGTSRNIAVKILEKYSKLKCGKQFYFSFLPERIIEGNALYELENVPQLVSGYSKKCKEQALEFCSKAFNTIIELENIEEGEIIKLASNAYRDLSFAFSNEISRISSYYSLSGSKLIEKANFGYPRNSIAKPSLGVGGYCLPKDPYLFSKLLGIKKKGYSLAKNSRRINENSVNEVFWKIKKFHKLRIKKKRPKVLILGITFKGTPETIDIRNSPSVELAKKLIKNKYYVKFFDVMYKELIKTNFKFSKILTNNKNLINKVDIIIVANLHNDYQKLIQENLKKNQTKDDKLIFDCWNILDNQIIHDLNWKYKNI